MRYDVYISLGEDTRYGFSGNLYNALCDKEIVTFMIDDKELRARGGEESIPSHVIRAIEESRILMVVLSPNYPSSTRCLDELVKILECSRAKGQVVVPVYYNVYPADVKYLTGSYGEAMAKHEERLQDDKDKVMKWKRALRLVATLRNYEITRKVDHEYISINKLVGEISKKLAIKNPWERYIGIGSVVVGLVCYALSSSFNRLYGDWTWWKISCYVVSSLVICLFISFPNAWKNWRIFQYKDLFAFLVLIFNTVFSYCFDRTLKEKPDAYGIVSSVAFAIMSLCMSKQVAWGFLKLMHYFCGLLITQLAEIEPTLGLVGVGFHYLLTLLGSYLQAPLGTHKKKRQDDIGTEQNP